MTETGTPLKVLIVEDVELAQLRLQRLLADLPDVQLAGTARHAGEALEQIRRARPELLLLDIDLPGRDGFALLEAIPQGAPIHVVFCTAHAQFAVQAFAFAAVDFLLKPIDGARLREAIVRVFQRVRQGQPAPHYLLLRERDQTRVLPMSAIDWVESAGNYVCIRAAGETHVHREPLARLHERLDPARFVRIHRSRIVNVSRIARLEPIVNGDHRVHLVDGTEMILSRTYRDTLFARLAQNA